MEEGTEALPRGTEQLKAVQKFAADTELQLKAEKGQICQAVCAQVWAELSCGHLCSTELEKKELQEHGFVRERELHSPLLGFSCVINLPKLEFSHSFS